MPGGETEGVPGVAPSGEGPPAEEFVGVVVAPPVDGV